MKLETHTMAENLFNRVKHIAYIHKTKISLKQIKVLKQNKPFWYITELFFTFTGQKSNFIFKMH